MYDFSDLNKEIKKFGDVAKLAEAINLDKRILAERLSNIKPFRTNEIEAIVKVLNIPREQIFNYFFCEV
jgi:hypothetical protein